MSEESLVPSGGREPAIVERPGDLRLLAGGWRAASLTVGLVPTMGALHRGHASLIGAARSQCDRVVVSIFVNPMQFAPGEDFLNYPRDFERDLDRLRALGVHACYRPTAAELYPEGFATSVEVQSSLTSSWEAEIRPTHFRGVSTVVAKLFAATGPSRAYFGEKDAQQAAVVTRLAADLDFGVEVTVCPVVRDSDGLALSSRNARLSDQGRVAALSLCRALRLACRSFSDGNRDGAALAQLAGQSIEQEPLAALDYAAVVDPLTFEPVERAVAGSRLIVAAQVDQVRLLDTAVVGVSPDG